MPTRSSLTIREIHDLTYAEISALIWQGVPASRHVGLREVFTDAQLLGITAHPAWDQFPAHFQSWVWSAIDASLTEEGF